MVALTTKERSRARRRQHRSAAASCPSQARRFCDGFASAAVSAASPGGIELDGRATADDAGAPAARPARRARSALSS